MNANQVRALEQEEVERLRQLQENKLTEREIWDAAVYYVEHRINSERPH